MYGSITFANDFGDRSQTLPSVGHKRRRRLWVRTALLPLRTISVIVRKPSLRSGTFAFSECGCVRLSKPLKGFRSLKSIWYDEGLFGLLRCIAEDLLTVIAVCHLILPHYI